MTYFFQILVLMITLLKPVTLVFAELKVPNKLIRKRSSFTGRYAHYDIVAYVEKISFIEMKTFIISYGLTDLYLENGVLKSLDRFCFSEHLSNLPFKTYVNDELTTAIIPKAVTMKVSQENNKIDLYRPRTPTALGTQLSDLENEKLPTSSSDPRLIDADNDGKPAVTVNIKLYNKFDAELYITRKEVFEYIMSVNEDLSITGIVIDNSEQSIVGAKPSFLKSQRNPRQNKDLTLSPIILKPVATDYSCDELKINRDQLFPANPKI